jgi:hypothetical protein
MTTPGRDAIEAVPEIHTGPVAALRSDGANMRFARHAQLLLRWPVLDEAWAHAVEKRRIEAVDRTPGPATFGR